MIPYRSCQLYSFSFDVQRYTHLADNSPEVFLWLQNGWAAFGFLLFQLFVLIQIHCRARRWNKSTVDGRRKKNGLQTNLKSSYT